MKLGSYPAYPRNNAVVNLEGRIVDVQEYGFAPAGMTIRQRYAMAAMQGMLSDYKHGEEMMQTYPDPNRDAGSVLALASFLIADAMIEFEEKDYEEKRKAE